MCTYLVLLLCLSSLLLSPGMLIAALVESWQTADAGDAGGWDDDSETGDEVLLSWDTSEESK